MDPFSLAASTVGFIALAMKLSATARRLYAIWSSTSNRISGLREVIDNLELLANVLASLGHNQDLADTRISKPQVSIKVLNKCQGDLQKLEAMSKEIWVDWPSSKSGQKWAALRIALKKDQISQFQKVLERTKTTLILELMLVRSAQYRQDTSDCYADRCC